MDGPGHPGAPIGSRIRGSPAIRRKATTGARPFGAETREGLGVAPSMKAASESSSAAVTTPWPPRPWIRTLEHLGSHCGRFPQLFSESTSGGGSGGQSSSAPDAAPTATTTFRGNCASS